MRESEPKTPRSIKEPIRDASSSAEARSNSALNRRRFFERSSTVAMVGGIAASYGTLGYCALRYLLPNFSDEPNLGWQFVASLQDITSDSLAFTTASGAKIVIAHHGAPGEERFIALSSVCPHLGCQVFWEAPNNRFFCPCHNGAFDRTGKAIAGPPAAARQSLKQYQTRVENGSLYVLAPLETVTQAPEEA